MQETYFVWEFNADGTVIQVVAEDEIQARGKAIGILDTAVQLVKVVECFNRHTQEDAFRKQWLAGIDALIEVMKKNSG